MNKIIIFIIILFLSLLSVVALYKIIGSSDSFLNHNKDNLMFALNVESIKLNNEDPLPKTVDVYDEKLSVIEKKNIVVGPYRESCVGLVEKKCLVIDGILSYTDIVGFEHEEGYFEKLDVFVYKNPEGLQDTGLTGLKYDGGLEKIADSGDLNSKDLCDFYDAEWIENVNECSFDYGSGRAGQAEFYCSFVEGELDTCASPCRNSVEDFCFDVCEIVCSLGE